MQKDKERVSRAWEYNQKQTEKWRRQKKWKAKTKLNESEKWLEKPIATILFSPNKDVRLWRLPTATFLLTNLITY